MTCDYRQKIIAPEALKLATDALTTIRDARDYCAVHGEYPPGYLGEDQEFDDWAADIADTVLAQLAKVQA